MFVYNEFMIMSYDFSKIGPKAFSLSMARVVMVYDKITFKNINIIILTTLTIIAFKLMC